MATYSTEYSETTTISFVQRVGAKHKKHVFHNGKCPFRYKETVIPGHKAQILDVFWRDVHVLKVSGSGTQSCMNLFHHVSTEQYVAGLNPPHYFSHICLFPEELKTGLCLRWSILLMITFHGVHTWDGCRTGCWNGRLDDRRPDLTRASATR